MTQVKCGREITLKIPAASMRRRSAETGITPGDTLGWLGLLCRAAFIGLSVSLIMAVLILLGASEAQAAEAPPGLVLYGPAGEPMGPAPQLRTDVTIEVTGMLVRVRVEQRFSNPNGAWVEGVYVFPLPEDAAVDRLQMRYGERLIEGEIQERRQAEKTYQHARAKGQVTSLLDQQRANIFTTAVANIPPGETVTVQIEYQQPVRWLEGEFSLRFPMVVGPRYIPGRPLQSESGTATAHGWAADTDQVPDASQITPPVVVGAAEGFNPLQLRVVLHVGLVLADIDSPYHPVRVEVLAPGEYAVELTDGAVAAERDFVLRWRPTLAPQPAAALFNEQWQGRHYSLLMVMPPRPEALPQGRGRELILVVDTSGSMHGASIEQARVALLSALQRLKPGDRFNVIQFNHTLRQLFDRAMPVDQASLQRARSYVRGLKADGGTEMLPAMRRALYDPTASGLLRQVVFLTDGAVGNEQAMFEAVAQDIGDSRLFTVGIGSAPNALLMRRAAQLGRGTFTYIGSTDEVEDKVAALFAQLSAPVLTDVQLRWDAEEPDGSVVQTPLPVPDLYAGEPLVVAVESGRRLRSVHIEGRLGTQVWRHTARLQGGADGAGVHALWARRMIDDWMARQVTGEDRAAVRDAVLRLALEHHLVSRYTSLVAVDKTPRRPSSGELQSAAVPARLPAGWSADAVFGRLPATATPAPLFMLLGLLGLALGWLVRERGA